MRFFVLCFVLVLNACSSLSPKDKSLGRAPSAEIENQNQALLTQRLVDLLGPRVEPTDRDLWTFRWEQVEKNQFNPKSVEDLVQRIKPWADRFPHTDIRSGADTGPGVYAAMDPVATVVFGLKKPRLYAIKIKQGSRILIGDEFELDPALKQSLRTLAKDMKCQSSSTDMYDLGHVIGYFRMNPSENCRKAVVDALRTLSVQAILFGFGSTPIPNCRVKATAVSIIDSNAISLLELNAYSTDGNIEGQPEITPYVKALYSQIQDDFLVQSGLNDFETLDLFKHGFGFFDKTPSIDPTSLERWKENHILYCGKKWSIEREDSKLKKQNEIRVRSNPEVKDLLIRLSFSYRDKYLKSGLEGQSKAPSEFRIYQIRGIRDLFKFSQDDLIELAFAQIPTSIQDSEKDKNQYLGLLKRCLHKYETEKFENVIQGECGIEP